MAKKNIRSIPPQVRKQMKKLVSWQVVAGCSRKYSAADLENGKLNHLGVQLTAAGLEFPDALIPSAASGKVSNRNVNGQEIVRKDLPKETHYNAVEAPDWGDSSNGTHTVYLPYEKYPRDFIGPKLRYINITAPTKEAGNSEYVLIFEIDEVLDARAPNFEESLLENLNLLQENLGTCGVQQSGASVADYMKSLTVEWEVLPPGTKEEAIQRLFRKRQPTQQEKDVVEERYNFLMSLNPQNLVYGMSGNQRYFGAMLSDNLVVFENIQYGNAIYVMFDDWKSLSKRSRLELISGRFGKNFDRVPHSGGWQGKVKAIVKEKLSQVK